MESNENSNQSVPAAYLEISDVKREPNEDSASETDSINRTILLNLQKLHGISGITGNDSNVNSMSGVKRKNSGDNSLNIQEEDRMSDATDSSNVVVKRRRYSESQCDESIANSSDILNTNSLRCKKEKHAPTLFVTSSPGEWTSQQIIDYIREECGINISNIRDRREGSSESEFQIKLKFPNKEQLDKVYEKLKEREAEGKLKVHADVDNGDAEFLRDNDQESDTMAEIDEREPSIENAPPIQDPDQIETASDENGYYIKEEYLNSLGIKMPITNIITVTNFRCDKSELKEVLELAGKVLICSVISISNKYANVMYSHPLEAVQAISMLNGQKFYGQPLKITMNNSKDTNILLPKGLTDIGPGLGKYGKGLPDLVDHFKRFVKGKKSSIDANLFQSELLRKIGIDSDGECSTPIAQSVGSNSSSNHNDNVSEQGSDIIETIRSNGNQFNTIGHMVTTETNLTRVTLNSVGIQNNRFILNSMVLPLLRRGTNGSVVSSTSQPTPRAENSQMSIPPGSVQDPRSNLPTSRAQISEMAVPPYSVQDPRSNLPTSRTQINEITVPPGALQDPRSNLPTSRAQNSQINLPPGSMTDPRSNLPISRAHNSHMSGPPGSIQDPRSNLPTPRAQISPMAVISSSMQGPRPNIPTPMAHNSPRAGLSSSMQGPRAAVTNSMPVYPNCPPIPGVDTSNPVRRSYNISVIGTNSMPMIPGPVLTRPMSSPMPSPMSNSPGPLGRPPMAHMSPTNRFPGPRNIGPRPAPAHIPNIPVSSPIRPSGPITLRPFLTQPTTSSSVQMFKGADPVTIQISNLPPSTNFVNLGQKLSEFGHVVYLEFTTPGCAIVRFASPTDADRCIQNYRNVLG